MSTTHYSLTKVRTVGVLDLEIMLDPAAAATAAYRGNGLPTALQRISTACVLWATERPDGSWGDFRIDTLSDPLTEFDILMRLDARLAELDQAGGAIWSYNGIAHDLAVIRRRGARHWMFGLPGITAATTMDHIDVMVRQRLGRRDRVPSLRDACAGLGISAVDPIGGPSPLAPYVRKCQTDVVATFLLGLYEMAMERGSPDALVNGWEGLSAHLSAMRPRATHLEHFREHRLLRAARKIKDHGDFLAG